MKREIWKGNTFGREEQSKMETGERDEKAKHLIEEQHACDFIDVLI
jgi:hypothetical protein